MSLPAADSPVVIAFGSHTDPGPRGTNEDSVWCGRIAPGSPLESVLLVVSDGVGGAEAGEVASGMVVEDLPTMLATRLGQEGLPADREDWMKRAALAISDGIREAATGRPGIAGMGATVSALWIHKASAVWLQAGDSRIYRLRQGELQQVTRDQSVVGRLRAAGQLTEEEARRHPYRHVIDQCLGGTGAPVQPEAGSLDITAGDVFLLCSDGLSDGLWDREIGEGMMLVAGGLPPAEAARAFIARALAAAARDNITVVVARVDAAKT